MSFDAARATPSRNRHGLPRRPDAGAPRERPSPARHALAGAAAGRSPRRHPVSRRAGAAALLAACAAALAGCASWAPDEPRAHDARRYAVDEAALRATLASADRDALKGHGAFPPLAGIDTDRWVGTLGEGADRAGWQVEVPRDWNGQLVMWAHGYRGEGAALTVAPPPIRRFLAAGGYAWAASSYSRNHYDVRAGVEDTNALALAFRDIAARNGRPLPAPRRVYVAGQSMGGHVAAAAVDAEALRHARHRVRYDGALPMCGVLGDTALYDYFAAYQVAAQQLAGLPATRWPVTGYKAIDPAVRAAIWKAFPADKTTGETTPAGDRLARIVERLSGGPRPLFDLAFRLPSGHTSTVWNTFGGDGTVNGVLGRNVVDTTRVVYRFDDGPALSAEERAFNDAAFRVEADPQANRRRRDGLRWVPKTNADFGVPVLTLHTLGDMYVPFSMQQVFRRRAEAQGTAGRLVQRAIRGVSHCDFTLAEQEEAFADLARWAQGGPRPAGDDVLAPAVVADPAYGCGFSRAPRADDAAGVRGNRATLVPACPAGSAAAPGG